MRLNRDTIFQDQNAFRKISPSCFSRSQSGNNIAEEKPQNRPEIEDRLEKLNVKWQELSDASKQKGTKLGDAQKQEEFNTGVQNIQQWFTEIEQTVVTHEKATDLTTATRLYQKHKVRLMESFTIFSR